MSTSPALPCLGCSWQPAPRTFLRLSPWEMLSAVMKAASRCVMAPASPQCGRNRNVFIPRCLGTGKEHSEQGCGWTQLQAQLCPYHESPGIQPDLGAHCSFSFLLCVCNRCISAITELSPQPVTPTEGCQDCSGT